MTSIFTHSFTNKRSILLSSLLNLSSIKILLIIFLGFILTLSFASAKESTSDFAVMPPANDDCANAILLTVNPDLSIANTVSGNIENATASSQSESCSGAFNNDIWYRFVASDTIHSIQTTNISPANGDLIFQVSTGSCGALTQIDCHDEPENLFVVSGLTIGLEYKLRIASYGTQQALISFDVCIGTLPPPPANDECSGALLLTVDPDLSCSNTLSGSIASATASSQGVSCSGAFNDDIWYRFVATDTIHLIQITNIFPGNSDLVFQVSSGSCGALTEIQCHDDPDEAFLVTGLAMGTEYKLRIASHSSQQVFASFDVCIGELPPPPANDECANALSLTVNPNDQCSMVTAGTVINATASPQVDDVTGEPNNDVWYSFVATDTNHRITLSNIVNVFGASSDMAMGIYDGTGGCNALTLIGDNDGNSKVLAGMTVGSLYYVRIYGWSSLTQFLNFDICISTPPPPPINNFCSGAIDYDVAFGHFGWGLLDFESCIKDTLDFSGYYVSNGGITCNARDNVQAWYRWFPVDTAIQFISGLGSPGLEIFEGSCGNLTSVGCLNNATGIIAGLNINTLYYMLIWADVPADSLVSWELRTKPNVVEAKCSIPATYPLCEDATYPANDLQTFLICPEPTDTASIVFTYFDIESSTSVAGTTGSGCWDYIEVFDDGVSLGTFCSEASGSGKAPSDPASDLSVHNTFTASAAGNCLTVVFNSDHDEQRSGFEFETVNCTPFNEICELAQDFEEAFGPMRGSDTCITYSLDLSNHLINQPSGACFIDHTAWYTWVATHTSFRYFSETFNDPPAFGMFEGDCNNLIQLECFGATSNDVIVDGLTVGETYYFAISAATYSPIATWSMQVNEINVTCQDIISYPICSATYTEDDLQTYLICPEAGQTASIEFTYFDIEVDPAGGGNTGNGCWDYIEVFDEGVSMGKFCSEASGSGASPSNPSADLSTNNIFTASDTGRCLTVVFDSDEVFEFSGYSFAARNCTFNNTCLLAEDFVTTFGPIVESDVCSEYVIDAFNYPIGTGQAGTCGTSTDIFNWYTWQATDTAVLFESQRSLSDGPLSFEIFEGSCGSLVSRGCLDQQDGIIGGLTAGQTYYFLLSFDNSYSTGHFNLSTPSLIDLSCQESTQYPSCLLDSTYSNNFSQTFQICPSATDTAAILFTYFDIEVDSLGGGVTGGGCSDYVEVFDDGVSMGKFCSEASGSSGLAPSNASSDLSIHSLFKAADLGNCLTVVFTSNDTIKKSGFSFEVIGCEPNNDCDGALDYYSSFGPIGFCASNPSTLDLTDFNSGLISPSCDQINNVTAWYSFVAESSTLIFESLQGNPGIEVFEGSVCGSAVSKGCLNNVNGTISGLTVGQSYFMVIWRDGQVGNHQISWNLVYEPELITQNFSCGDEIDFPVCDNLYANDIIQSFMICPQSGELASITFTYFDLGVGVIGNEVVPGCRDYVEIFDDGVSMGTYCSEASGSGAAPYVPNADLSVHNTFTASDTGQCLEVVFRSDEIIQRTGFKFVVSGCFVVNDMCSEAIDYEAFFGPIEATCEYASQDMSNHVNGASLSCFPPANAASYYTWIATDTALRFQSGAGSPGIQVMTGGSSACTSTDIVACLTSDGTIGGLTIGTQYTIVIWDQGSPGAANVSWCLSLYNAPPNDVCTDALDYVSIFGPLGTNQACVHESLVFQNYTAGNDSITCNAGMNPTAWYTWVATDTALLFTSFDGNPGLEIFEGTCGTMTSKGCLDQASGSINGLSIDSTYYIVIWDDGASPDASLNWSLTTPVPLLQSPICGELASYPICNASNYSNFDNQTFTICPEGTDTASIVFTYFDIEVDQTGAGRNGGCWDYIEVFDDGVSMGTFCSEASGSGLSPFNPATDLSTNNMFTASDTGHCLTVVFTSDAVETRSGFAFEVINCTPGIDGMIAPIEYRSTQRCESDFSDICIEIENQGSQPITSAVIDMTWDGGSQSVNYVGNLAMGQKDTICLPAVQTFSGVYDFTFSLDLSGDVNAQNNSFQQVFGYANVPSPPIISSADSILSIGDSTTLTVFNTSQFDPFWYDEAGNLVASVSDFSTGPIYENTTFYASLINAWIPEAIGPQESSSIGSGGYNTIYAAGLEFDVSEFVVLNSIKIYPLSAGTVVINIGQNSQTLLSGSVNLTQGYPEGIVIAINTTLPAGTNYFINADGSDVPLFRNNGGAEYPYRSTFDEVVITGSNNSFSDYYYFFYDWIILKPCLSEQAAFTVSVDCSPVLSLTGLSTDGEVQRASNYINSTQTISDPDMVNYKAADSILLLPDFEVELGAEFTATIEDCSSQSSREGSTSQIHENSTVETEIISSVANSSTRKFNKIRAIDNSSFDQTNFELMKNGSKTIEMKMINPNTISSRKEE